MFFVDFIPLNLDILESLIKGFLDNFIECGFKVEIWLKPYLDKGVDGLMDEFSLNR